MKRGEGGRGGADMHACAQCRAGASAASEGEHPPLPLTQVPAELDPHGDVLSDVLCPPARPSSPPARAPPCASCDLPGHLRLHRQHRRPPPPPAPLPRRHVHARVPCVSRQETHTAPTPHQRAGARTPAPHARPPPPHSSSGLLLRGPPAVRCAGTRKPHCPNGWTAAQRLGRLSRPLLGGNACSLAACVHAKSNCCSSP